ncbi:hypothetical protein [Actinomadura macrotermitis]|uniref:Uncharacterized protein n=1 Tax=Actinomadura macrotermitis TaxID=2585200 RepID=A0A7K0C1A9_9ACTN|nr:hypothetical protein [Actinomadura macrotermitis]MQY07255.1 hypothetical protein [Actinomadura macrotermitis]
MRSRARRYLVEFEAPDSDGEFIATCLAIGDLLALAADRIDDWVQDLAARGIPAPVIAQFEQVVLDLDAAAGDARRSAANFADYFEDARAIAARGIRIIGTSRRRAA